MCVIAEGNKINAALTMSLLFLPRLPLLTVPLFQSTLAALTLSILAFRDTCLLLILYTSTYSTVSFSSTQAHKYIFYSLYRNTPSACSPPSTSLHPLQKHIFYIPASVSSTSASYEILCESTPDSEV